MKKIIAFTILLMYSCLSNVYATDADQYANDLLDFTYLDKMEGVDVAVKWALEEGIDPDQIVKMGYVDNTINPQNLIKALYCEGALGQDIREAAQKYNISDIILTYGYKKSITECSMSVADSQEYTALRYSGVIYISPKVSSGRSYASPSQP